MTCDDRVSGTHTLRHSAKPQVTALPGQSPDATKPRPMRPQCSDLIS